MFTQKEIQRILSAPILLLEFKYLNTPQRMDRSSGDHDSPSMSPSQSAVCTGQAGGQGERSSLDIGRLHLLSWRKSTTSFIQRRRHVNNWRARGSGDTINGSGWLSQLRSQRGSVCMWSVSWWLPDTDHVPDHQSGVQPVQAERHPGRWDAIWGVQHLSAQRT